MKHSIEVQGKAYIDRTVIMADLGITSATFYRWRDKGLFPQPIKFASQLYLRKASDEEAAKWRHGQAQALAEGEIVGGDNDYLVYLVPVSDPTDEVFDDDEP